MTKIAGSGSASGSISQRHGLADPDTDPDPQQNVMDPEHCRLGKPESFSNMKFLRFSFLARQFWSACVPIPNPDPLT
jgi:hypothetical protein